MSRNLSLEKTSFKSTELKLAVTYTMSHKYKATDWYFSLKVNANYIVSVILCFTLENKCIEKKGEWLRFCIVDVKTFPCSQNNIFF